MWVTWDSLCNSLTLYIKKKFCLRKEPQLYNPHFIQFIFIIANHKNFSHFSCKSTSFSLTPLYWNEVALARPLIITSECDGDIILVFMSHDAGAAAFGAVDHSLLETLCPVVSFLPHQTHPVSLAGSSSSLKPLQIEYSQDLSLIKLLFYLL